MPNDAHFTRHDDGSVTITIGAESATLTAAEWVEAVASVSAQRGGSRYIAAELHDATRTVLAVSSGGV